MNTDTQRLTERQVWNLLEWALDRLDVGVQVRMTTLERRRLARIARECARELRMRGQQLQLVD